MEQSNEGVGRYECTFWRVAYNITATFVLCFGRYILPGISDFKTSNSNFDVSQEPTRTDILMNKLLFPASVQMLWASITLTHPLKCTLPNNKPETNSSKIHWPWPINQAFCQNKIYFVPDLCWLCCVFTGKMITQMMTYFTFDQTTRWTASPMLKLLTLRYDHLCTFLLPIESYPRKLRFPHHNIEHEKKGKFEMILFS